MELSKRMNGVADLVITGKVVADIGTDHGYIPIHLIKSGKVSRVIAADINAGPLMRAKNHVAAHGLAPYIETRLSDGLLKIEPGEVDSVVIAGMGGGLVIKILSQSPLVVEQLNEIVLQPQSEVSKVRRYLGENQFIIIKEDIICEDGKYYPMMRVEHGNDLPYSYEELLYGRLLIRDKHPVLKGFLRREIKEKQKITGELAKQNDNGTLKKRGDELREDIERAFCILERMES